MSKPIQIIPTCVAPSHWIDGARLWNRLQELSLIGGTPLGGVNPPCLSETEVSARRKLIGWAADWGASVQTDAIGNLFLRREGAEPDLPPVLVGSYCDSQPGGGKYSGAYGMLAAIESLAAIARLEARNRRPIVVVSWTNGEGSRFVPGYTGSEAFAGRRAVADILGLEDIDGRRFSDELATMLRAQGDLPAVPLGFGCAAYVEAHLEQGPILESNACQIGICTGIQGVRRFQVRVTGEAAHVGTTPRSRRRDALYATVKLIGALDQFFAAPDVGFAIGHLRVKPNAPSIVPSETLFSIDIRHRDNTILTRLGNSIRLICESEKGQCDIIVTEIASTPPVDFAPEVRERIRASAERLGLSHMPILSLAGHDAQSLTWICPSGIVLIPCRGGISHNEAESIDPAHATAGAQVLADVIWELAS